MHENAQTPEVNAWQLRITGHYAQAIAIYTEHYQATGDPVHLYNRGSIYVEIGEYARALDDFELLRSIKAPAYWTDGESMYQGICCWYLDQPGRAVDFWKRGLDAPYTDAAGGVRLPSILLYAGLRLNDSLLQKESLKILRKHMRRKLGAWPGPIVPFLLGTIDQPELLRRMQPEQYHERLVGRWQCQAHFYIAVHALQHDDQAGFQQQCRHCAASLYGRLEHEYYLARWEIQRKILFPAFDETPIPERAS